MKKNTTLNSGTLWKVTYLESFWKENVTGTHCAYRRHGGYAAEASGKTVFFEKVLNFFKHILELVKSVGNFLVLQIHVNHNSSQWRIKM